MVRGLGERGRWRFKIERELSGMKVGEKLGDWVWIRVSGVK